MDNEHWEAFEFSEGRYSIWHPAVGHNDYENGKFSEARFGNFFSTPLHKHDYLHLFLNNAIDNVNGYFDLMLFYWLLVGNGSLSDPRIL